MSMGLAVNTVWYIVILANMPSVPSERIGAGQFSHGTRNIKCVLETYTVVIGQKLVSWFKPPVHR